MKVIDLLNKIAKDEEVPKKIKCGNTIYIYDEFEKDYVDDFYEDILKRETRHTGDILYFNYLCKKLGSGSYLNITKQLNYELEIIEEDKEIEKIKIDNQNRIQALSTGNFVYKVNQPTKIIIYKINELIDEINKLKEKK